MNNQSFFSRSTVRLIAIVIALIVSQQLLAQDFFPCGVFNFDVWGPEIPFSSDEFQRIRNINANWVGSVSLTAQGGMIDSFSTASGEIRKMTLDMDTLARAFGHYYVVNRPGNIDYDPENTLLWRYLCDNDLVAYIDSAHVDSFVTHIDLLYNGSSGLGGIMVAHQGRTNQQDRWPFIKYACSLIQRRFGDAVQAVVVYNTLDWTGISLENFFRYMEDTLDVFQHECYPFRAAYPNPAAYIGDDFQNLVDEYIAGCDSAHLNLVKSKNINTRLEMYIQTFEARYENTYFRRPTQAEIWLQSFLALSRNFKGIHSYVYRSHDWPTTDYETGLIDSLTRLPINNPPQNPPYNNVAGLYAHLNSLGPQILPLEVDTAFTWTGSAPQNYPLIQGITGYALDGNHHTIEVSLMDHPSNNYDYFMLINRRCNRDSAGV